MVDDAKKASAKEAAPKKAASSKAGNQTDVVNVKNISDGLVNTSKSSIEPGEKGQATVAELRTYSKYLEKA